MDAMDAISALDTAACILAITEFITELLSTSGSPEVQPPLSPDGIDEHTTWGTLEELRIAISDIQIPSMPQQPSASAFRPLRVKQCASAARTDLFSGCVRSATGGYREYTEAVARRAKIAAMANRHKSLVEI